MTDTKRMEESSKYGAHQDLSPMQDAPVGVLEEGSLDPVYEAKAR